jgi:hypothetical protein
VNKPFVVVVIDPFVIVVNDPFVDVDVTIKSIDIHTFLNH